MTRILTVVACLHLMAPLTEAWCQSPVQHVGATRLVSFNQGWRYLEDPVIDVHDLPSTTRQWITVDLPHTWNVFDVVDMTPGYRRSAGWYEKRFTLDPGLGTTRVLLYFEGVNTKSSVYVNGAYAGGHVGGYLGFELDVTPFIDAKHENTVLVRADNSIDPNVIPSQKSDFFIYGGLCRNVWLKMVPRAYIRQLTIRPHHVSAERAGTAVTVSIVHTGIDILPAVIDVVLNDRHGSVVAQMSVEQSIVAGENIVELEIPSIAHPELWSPADPALYTASARLLVSSDVIDVQSDRYGYRWFEFKEHGPFYLNGKRLLLRGTQRHEEHAGYGNALPDSLQRRDIRMVKEMGANFIRLAHYPQAPEVYRACDEIGLLVWDELAWCRGGMGGREWKANTRRMLKELITQNFNHPSIIMWSLGNELYWLPDFPGGDNVDSLRAFLTILNADAHRLDPGRVTCTRKFYEGSDIVDVFSPSIWMGWYSSAYHDYEKSITRAFDTYPRLFHAEYGGDSHVGRHCENPVSGDGFTTPDGWDSAFVPTKVKNVSLLGDWSESYMVNLIDWHLHVSEQLEWFTGNAQWILKDFGTPLRPENPIPYVNQKGAMDRAGNPKDIYYVYKSYWTTDPMFCYIESHSWTERSGPMNVQRPVKVYSNCGEVELLLNGISEGKRRRDPQSFPACGLLWDVSFADGVNTLRAIGYENGLKVADDSLVVTYSFKHHKDADRIEVSASPAPGGTILVTARVVDKDGQRCLSYNKRLYFSSTGVGHLRQDYGTPKGSAVIEAANGEASIVFVPAPAGSAVIEVLNQDFRGAYLNIHDGMVRR